MEYALDKQSILFPVMVQAGLAKTESIRNIVIVL